VTNDPTNSRGVTYFEAQNFPPPSALVHPSFGAHSRPGRFHTVNEDHYLITRVGRSQETVVTSLPDNLVGKRFDEEGFAMVVADGLGNSGAGESASRVALVTLIQLILNFCRWNLRIDDRIAEEIMGRAERFFRHVDSAVVYEAPQRFASADHHRGVWRRRDFFAHVGHSRAYCSATGRWCG
jgi:hypothetical protein